MARANNLESAGQEPGFELADRRAYGAPDRRGRFRMVML